MTELVQICDVETKRFDGTWKSAISQLRVQRGSDVCIVGSSDSGKTGIAFFVAGVEDRARVRGHLLLDGSPIDQISWRERSRRLAIVPNDPALLFSGIRTSLAGELELSLQALGMPVEARERIRLLVLKLRLEAFLDRDPFTLSGGEQVRAAVAIALVKSPDVLVLDDIFPALDPEATDLIRSAIVDHLNAGGAIVEIHSCAPEWIGEADHCVFLINDQAVQGNYDSVWRDVGRRAPTLLSYAANIAIRIESESDLRFDVAPVSGRDLRPALQAMTRSVSPNANRAQASSTEPARSEALITRDLVYQYQDNGFRLGPISFSLNAGQIGALIGPNGAGKTTCLRALALLLMPSSGTVNVRHWDGTLHKPPAAEQRHGWARCLIYAFQNPDDQIYLPTLRQELAETARRIGHSDPNADVLRVAAQLEIETMLDRAPVDFPRSLRRFTSLGACLVAQPPVLVLDEPTTGLDGHQKLLLGQALAHYTSNGGCILMVSHDYDFVMEHCSVVMELRDGRLSAIESVADLTSERWPATTLPTLLAAADTLPFRQTRHDIRTLLAASPYDRRQREFV